MLLRSEGLRANPGAIGRILAEEGYVVVATGLRVVGLVLESG